MLSNANFVSEHLSCAELKYNLTADVHHKDGFPSRFYFSGNGTSNVTAGRVKAKHEQLSCTTHLAFMKVRDFVYCLCWGMVLLTQIRVSQYCFTPKTYCTSLLFMGKSEWQWYYILFFFLKLYNFMHYPDIVIIN